MTHTSDGLLQAYLDDELTDPQGSGVETHLFGCGECAAELRELKSIAAEFRQAVRLIEVDVPMAEAQRRFAAAQGLRPAAVTGDVVRFRAPASITRIGRIGILKAAPRRAVRECRQVRSF
jgi:anti-sigma factor RsiW